MISRPRACWASSTSTYAAGAPGDFFTIGKIKTSSNLFLVIVFAENTKQVAAFSSVSGGTEAGSCRSLVADSR